MDIIEHKFEPVDESSEENVVENVSLVLEDSEFISCDADDETTTEGLHYQYAPKLYSSDGNGETVAYQLLHIDENDSREIQVAIPNSVKHEPMQLLASPVNGQFYVISNDSEPFTTQTLKPFTPRASQLQVKSQNSSVEPVVPKKRDAKRRETHNEVERRRRGKINTWIRALEKLLPECKVSASDVRDSKQTFESQSKGGILSRACDYIQELKETNQTLDRFAEENKELKQELKNLRQLVSQLKKENSFFKEKITAANGNLG